MLHLRELRRRLMQYVAVVLVLVGDFWLIREPLFQALIAPLMASEYAPESLIFTSVAELFFTYLKLSFISAFFVSIPYLVWQIWRFAAPGMYKHEKRFILPLLTLSPALFYAGGAFMYYFVMPIIVDFFLSFSAPGLAALPTVGAYLSFLLKMVFGFGLAFELPVILLLLVSVGAIKPEQLAYFRRYALVIILLIAAVLTPPDPISQLMLAIPMYMLYELAVLAAKLIAKNKQQNTTEEGTQ